MSEALPAQAQVVVIGAGVTGCSAAYHLTRLGVKDVVVIERHQLGCGTTWHSAGNITLLESLPSLMALFRRTRRMIPELEKEAGQSVGWRNCGRVVLARSEARLDDLRRIRSLGRVMGVEVEIIGPEEVKKKFPLMRTDDLVGAAWSPGDGRVNPTDITAAYMRVARQRGARLVEDTKVTGFAVEGGRVTGVETDKGNISCESVVLAAGLWSRRIGAMAGVRVPLYAAEHFYVLTKPIPGVTPDLPVFRDPDALIYGREEVGGLLVGCFDRGAKPLPLEDLPEDFAFGLLSEDWDQFGPYMPGAIERIPALETAEIRTLLNGPESFTPDGLPLIGPAPGLEGFWVAAGMNSGGITASSSGAVVAEWLVEGESEIDTTAMDLRRFAPAQNGERFLKARVSELPSFHFDIHSPGHDFQTGRGLRRSPLHDRMAAAGAVFAAATGYERPVWFETGTAEGWEACLAEELAAAAEDVALFDLSSITKLVLTGPDTSAVLTALAGTAPPDGLATSLVMTNGRGGIEAAPMAVPWDGGRLLLDLPEQLVRLPDWIARNRPADSRCACIDLTGGLALIGLQGPKAGELLAATGAGRDGMTLGESRMIEIGYTTGRLVRLGAGDDAWLLILPAEMAVCAHEALTEAGGTAGDGFGLRHAGHLAAEALRLDAGRPAWGLDFGPKVTAAEAGLAPADGRGRALRAFSFPAESAKPMGAEPILKDGKPAGLVSSAAWLPTSGRAVVMGLVPKNSGEDGWTIDLRGEEIALRPHPAGGAES
ncbi:MAG: GcvT family protein [Rhodospirillaceae bacterium]|jgi:glycine/D-amino acid oxidase-like deaminating enzyme/glycine cleavage system aminomethyltransferase T|nr:GcvT family protein [Rhodospirillaceae bacterium]MBT6118192.1 GcvT family protein [Rhodospirillaceae bacterium]